MPGCFPNRRGNGLRTFVAVELDDHCRDGLVRAIGDLKRAASGVRWVKPDSLHVTLKFIGEIKPTDLPVAIDCLQHAAGAVEPFTMSVAGLSGFPPRGTPRVVHVHADGPGDVFERLHEAVEEVLAEELGVSPEKRRYIPHITLGRVKKRGKCPPLEAMKEAVPDDDFGEVDVDSVLLMESDLQPEGAVYTVLHRFPLG